MASPLLVVSFDTKIGSQVHRILRRSGHDVDFRESVNPAKPQDVQAVVLITDVHTDPSSIMDGLLAWSVPLLVISNRTDSTHADWITIDPDRIDSELLDTLYRHTQPYSTDDGAVWASDAMLNIRNIVRRIAPTNLPVLITGESGTGKEVIAQTLHNHSQQCHRSMVVVDCAAIAPTLMESELFGHQKGAFTGASKTTGGLVRKAHQSTFFLDEIGELPTPVQVKLLRLLQDGSYRSVGGTESKIAKLRIIAATNRDIEAEVSAGRFRRDLYHRLNGARIHIPPLRERVADIQPLFDQYLARFSQREGRESPVVSEDTMQLIRNAHWPGNIRELVNCAHYVASLCSGNRVDIDDLPPALRHRGNRVAPGILPVDETATPISSIRTDLPYKDAKREWLDIFEEHYIQDVLQRNLGNVSAAANEAGMDRRSIQRILKRIRRESGAEQLDE